MYFIRFKWFYIAGFVVVVGLIIGGWIWWRSLGGEQEVVSGDKVEEVNETKTDDGERVDTSDWKTYRNEEYGFEIKYPQSWMAIENWGINFRPSVVSLISPETKKATEDLFIHKKTGTINIYVFQKIEDIDRDEKGKNLVSYLDTAPEISSYKEINLNGIPAFESWIGGHDMNYVIFLKANNSIYEIFLGRKYKKENISNAEKKVMSTFRFLIDKRREN